MPVKSGSAVACVADVGGMPESVPVSLISRLFEDSFASGEIVCF